MSTQWIVVIKCGATGGYSPKVGWDDVFRSKGEAIACAARAAQNDGWSARVVEAQPSADEESA